jgi:hypothetical protein
MGACCSTVADGGSAPAAGPAVLCMVAYPAAAGKTATELTVYFDKELKAPFQKGLAPGEAAVMAATDTGVCIAMRMANQASLDKYRSGLCVYVLFPL